MKLKRMRAYSQSLHRDQWKAIKQIADFYHLGISEFVRARVIPDFLRSFELTREAELLREAELQKKELLEVGEVGQDAAPLEPVTASSSSSEAHR